MVVYGWWFRNWALGLRFWFFYVMLMGFSAYGVEPYGFFGVGAVYINAEE